MDDGPWTRQRSAHPLAQAWEAFADAINPLQRARMTDPENYERPEPGSGVLAQNVATSDAGPRARPMAAPDAGQGARMTPPPHGARMDLGPWSRAQGAKMTPPPQGPKVDAEAFKGRPADYEQRRFGYLLDQAEGATSLRDPRIQRLFEFNPIRANQTFTGAGLGFMGPHRLGD